MMGMARKPRGLFLLFEGLPQTVVDSQVFAGLRWLSKEGVADFDVLTIACSDATYKQSLERLNHVRTHAVGQVWLERGYRQRLPGAALWHRRLVREALRRSETPYKFVHARTDYAAAIAGPVAASLGIPLIWDCRGDSVAEFRERHSGELLGDLMVRLGERALLHHRRLAARHASKVIAVSTTLAVVIKPMLNGRQIEVIPCLGDGDAFGFDPVLRHQVRQTLGYATEHQVYVYVGSMAPYQGFEAALSAFERLIRVESNSRLLVLTPGSDAAERSIRGRWGGCVNVKTVPFDEVNGYLAAADCAVMLRPTSGTNSAAFPTKFAEYGLSGLPVLMNRAVPDCWRFSQAAANAIPIQEDTRAVVANLAEKQNLGDEERFRVATHYRQKLTRPGYRAEYDRLYG